MKGIIYRYFNKLTNQNYIGQTINEQARRNAHESCIGKTKFHKAIIQYGLINFEYSVIEIIEESTKRKLCDKLNEREIYWIDYYDSFNNGYNSNKGGGEYNKSLKYKLDIQSRKEQGLHVNGRPLFGYKTNENKEYIINEEEAEIIRKIFNMYCYQYLSGYEIAKITKIKESKIFNILNNKTYIGITKGKPTIISRELFDLAQYHKINHLNTSSRKYIHPLYKKIFDINNKILRLNTCLGVFFNTDENGHYNISLNQKTADLMYENLKELKYDKIKLEKLDRYKVKAYIYNNNVLIKTLLLNTYSKKIIKEGVT